MKIVFALLAAIVLPFADTGLAQTNELATDQAVVPQPLTAQPPVAQLPPVQPLLVQPLTGQPLSAQAPAAQSPAAQPFVAPTPAAEAATDASKEFPSEYGTPATVIRNFYAALAEGNGDLAALGVVPEKTVRGAFSASEMNRFYGNLREPITLVDLFRTGKAEYIAHYRYAASARRCDGRAVVRTVTRGQRYYIERIRALNGC